MNILVAYYTRTGNNRTIAEEIAKELSADLDEIFDDKKRSGIIGWLKAGRESMGKKMTTIKYTKNPQDYDAVILCGPIWAGNPPPPIRTYLTENDFLRGKKVAFSICSGGDGYIQALEQLKEMTPDSEHVATFGITQKQFVERAYHSELESFIANFK